LVAGGADSCLYRHEYTVPRDTPYRFSKTLSCQFGSKYYIIILRHANIWLETEGLRQTKHIVSFALEFYWPVSDEQSHLSQLCVCSPSNAPLPPIQPIFSRLSPHQKSSIAIALSQSINHGPASPSKSQIRYLLRAQTNVVLSGDTIVLVGKPRPGGKPPTERILSLAYVSAPRLKREGDEVDLFTVLT
jgi:hypothetical protein